MKRFLIFGYDGYYPGGAAQDFLGSVSELSDLDRYELSSEYVDAFDTETGDIFSCTYREREWKQNGNMKEYTAIAGLRLREEKKQKEANEQEGESDNFSVPKEFKGKIFERYNELKSRTD